MSLLGCQSKMLWNEVYCQIVDIITSKSEKVGIIVCKYFHDIHSELLETFYSYMQTLNQQSISLKFIILTEELSFIPENIINCCKVISVSRPSKSQYNKCLKSKLKKDLSLDEITNMKNIQASITQLMKPYELTCNKIINQIVDIDNLKFNKFRDLLYEIFIYDLDITDCIWFILNTLVERNKLNKDDISEILIRTFTFLQYYNNNYRPIYHLENYIFYLISKVNGFSNGD
jgi:predicted house-cleaning noncanonical NTP pyrophosphatase (MazG superfamily)